MILLAKLIGIAICAFGIYLVALPDKAKEVMSFFKKQNRMIWPGVLRALVGVVLLLAAYGSRVPHITVSLGMIFLLSGVLVFILGSEKMAEQMTWWEAQNQLVFRVLGLVVLAFGILVFSAA